jgi:GEVED domain/Secretion system C-terminal sorting domain
MKKLYFLITSCAFLLGSSASAQYCSPPVAGSGPFTGIIDVQFAGITNTTLGTDGYTDYTAGTAGSVEQGMSYAITIEMEHTLLNGSFTDMVDLRVWIDWNQNDDFIDSGEELISQLVDVSILSGGYNTATYNGNITVPSGATLGNTRMRVYEDMLVSDGHSTPTPCGYTTGNGQHGEAEDYTLTVVAAGGGASIEEQGSISNFEIYPNPSSTESTISFNLTNSDMTSIQIFNFLGELVYTAEANFIAGPNTLKVNTSTLEKGTYIVSISTSEGIVSKRISVL